MTKLIKQLSGTWTIAEKENPGPMFPNGGSGKGTATMMRRSGRIVFGGDVSLLRRDGPQLRWRRHILVGPQGAAFRGLWCDNLTPNGCDASGTTKWDGDKLVSTMQSDSGGQMMMSRYTYSDWTPNSFVMTIEMGSDANSLKPAMTITYTKAGTPMVVRKKPL